MVDINKIVDAFNSTDTSGIPAAYAEIYAITDNADLKALTEKFNTAIASATDDKIKDQLMMAVPAIVNHTGSQEDTISEVLKMTGKEATNTKDAKDLTRSSLIIDSVASKATATEDQRKEVLRQANQIILNDKFDMSAHWSGLKDTIEKTATALGLSKTEVDELLAKIEKSITDDKKSEISDHLSKLTTKPFHFDDDNKYAPPYDDTPAWKDEKIDKFNQWGDDKGYSLENIDRSQGLSFDVYKKTAGGIEPEATASVKYYNNNFAEVKGGDIELFVQMIKDAKDTNGITSISFDGQTDEFKQKLLQAVAQVQGMAGYEDIKIVPSQKEKDINQRANLIMRDTFLAEKWGGDLNDVDAFVQFKIEQGNRFLVEKNPITGDINRTAEYTAWLNALTPEARDNARNSAAKQIDAERTSGKPMSEYKFGTEDYRKKQFEAKRKELEDNAASAGAGSAEEKKFKSREEIEKAREKIKLARQQGLKTDVERVDPTDDRSEVKQYNTTEWGSVEDKDKAEITKALETLIKERNTRV